jgi:hypothetical protein
VWTDFCAAEWLFANEVAWIDDVCRDKKKTRRLWAITQLLSRNGLMSFLKANWKKQRRLLKSETLRMLLIKTECTCESHLLYLKSFWTDFLLSYQKKNLKRRVDKLIKAVHCSIRAHCIVLAGYKVPKGFRAANTVDGLRTA